MTQEEKAKAYDEALKDIRVIYPNLRGDTKLAIEHVFPELTESENKRIRKAISYAICAAVHQDGTLIDHVTKEEALAYLEKQKEQQLVEWSEEDELMRKRCIVDLGYLTEYEPQYKGRYDAQIEWLKSLFERFNYQLKQEWNEDDERMFNSLCTVLHGGLSSIPTEQFISWLKSFRLHPHWKPSEEQMDYLCRAVVDAKRIYDTSTNGYDAYFALKSLYNDLQKLL